MIAFDNLWKAFILLPGTRYARIMLTLWEFVLQGIAAAGTLAGYEYGGTRWWAVGGGAAGMVAAFWVHEFFFAAYVRYVVRIPLMDDGSVVGRDHHADYTFERFIGPVA